MTYYGLDIGGILAHFETLEEAKKHYKNFPIGTYKIGEI